jgi:type IV pilus secretin PilQ/predicted competence protein
MMRKVQYILLGALVLLGISCSAANPVAPAGPAEARAKDVQKAAATPTLTTIRSELVPEPRLVLEASEAPAYTSYRPQGDVFVVDLPRVVKKADLAIPTNLPEFVASLSAEEVIELGAPMTRVTLRFTEKIDSAVSMENGKLIIRFDGSDASEIAAAGSVEYESEIPVVVEEIAGADLPPPPRPEPVPVAVVADPARPVSADPRPVPQHAATRLEGVEYRLEGGALSVLLRTDGRTQHKSFVLDNPLRLVVDLDGVVNRVDRNTHTLSDPFVKKIRVAQFQSNPSPVARVVLDLADLPDYTLTRVPDGLRISFGGSRPAASPAPPATAPGRNQPPQQASVSPVSPSGPTVQANRRPADDLRAPSLEPIAVEHVVHGPQETVREGGAIRSTVRHEPVDDVFGTRMVEAPLGGATMRAPGQSIAVGAGERIYTGEPIDLSLTNADIVDVLRLFSELTGLNMAIDPGVSGTVTVDFTGVPWDQALDLILRQNNLGYTLEGNVMRIGTLDRLAAETAKRRQLAEEERLNVPLNTMIKYLSYAKAADIQRILSAMATPRGRIIVDPRTNQLIITEVPENLQTMLALIETIDIPTPQVVIEARIVETTKTFGRRLGIIWGFTGNADPALGSGTGLAFPNRIFVEGGPFDLSAGANPVLAVSLSNVLGTFDLDMVLTAAENEGLVKVVSAPKVTTQDNEQAEIQSGVQIPVQTRVNFTTTVTYIDATLLLNVTPQVTAEGTVIMEIQVQKTEPALGLEVAGAQNSPLITRRAQTKLMVRDGGTAVIGGIYQATENDSQNRVPFIHEIPVLGNLFKSRAQTSRHDELLIFITPRIVRNP